MSWWILENTLIAAVLALFVALVCRAQRVPPVVRHGLWLVVLIRLIAPPVFSVSLPVPETWRDFGDGHRAVETAENALSDHGRPDPPTLRAEASGLAPRFERSAEFEIPIAATAEIVEFSPIIESSTDPEEPAPESAGLGTEIPEHPVPPVEKPAGVPSVSNGPRTANEILWSCFTLLFWGAMAGTIVAIAVQCVRILRMYRVLSRSRPAPAELMSVVRDLAGRVKVRGPPVRLSSEIQSPLVCSLGRAVLLWPAARVDEVPEPGRQAVIVHELAHLARRDHWIGWLELVAGCVWWWNPLFWYVRHQLSENAELACDAWVTGLLPEGRRAYARALVDLAEFSSLKRRAARTFGAAALGIGDGSRTLFERRLVMIMGEGVRYRLGAGGLIGMGLLALATLPGCTAGQAADEPASALYQTEADLSDPPVLQARPAEAESQVVVDPASPASEAVGDLPRISLAPLTPPIVADPTLEGGTDALFPAVKSPPDAARPDAAAVSPEDRIKRLEDRFDAILAELRELKNPGQSKFKSAVKNSDPTSSTPTVKRKLFATAQAKPVSETTLDPASSGPEKPGYAKKPPRAEGEPEAVTLTRTTYKLPPGRAQAVAAFFAQNLNDEIEVRVKGETLQVTATAEDQTAIGHLVRLLQTRGPDEPKPSGERTKFNGPAPKSSDASGENGESGSARKF